MASKTSSDDRSHVLMTKHDTVRTIHAAEAHEAVMALRDFLDCDAVTHRACPLIRGDHDWREIVLAPKFHRDARVFLDGWTRGRVDGIRSGS